jgi:tripartite-type tricarboxylate transporter receptor subunit TctC
MFVTVNSGMALWKSGKIKFLATAAGKRVPQFPDLPTVAEDAGLPGFEGSGWYGLHAPTGTPRPIIDKINAEVRKIIAEPTFRARFVDSEGGTVLTGSPEEFAEMLKTATARLSKIVREANVKVE